MPEVTAKIRLEIKELNRDQRVELACMLLCQSIIILKLACEVCPQGPAKSPGHVCRRPQNLLMRN